MAGILSMNDVSKVGKLGLRALMAMVFASAQIPVECVAIVAGIDRIVDMGRTVMSITHNSVTNSYGCFD